MRKKGIFNSTIYRTVAIIVILVLPINILTLILSNMALKNNREQIVSEIRNTMDTNMNVLGDMLSRAVKRLSYYNEDQREFVELSSVNELTVPERAVFSASAVREINSIKMEYPWVDMMYFYYPHRDLLISSGFPGISQPTYRSWIAENAFQQSTSAIWRYEVMEDTSIVIGMSAWRNANFGVIVNLERLIKTLGLDDLEDGRCVYFTDGDQELMTKKGQEYLLELDMSLEQLKSSSRYAVEESTLKGYDLTMVEIIAWDKQTQNLSVTILILQVASILMAVLVIPMLLWYIHRAVIRPLRRLTGAIDKVEEGNLDYRIQAGKQSREFEQINENFNHMMDEVQHLKIDVYEKEIERKNIKMRYLSQQIKPHFIMNAMNIIYSYEPEEYGLIQKMVLCISKYFRYIVKVNDRFVELRQEMDHIKNYFEIQKARYPDMFFSIVEYDERLRNALIPPLIVQNFAENAIKYSLRVGKKITILLVGEYYEQDSEDARMRIRLADTGEGIPEDILEAIRKFQETGVMQEKLGVGIQNSIERLKYLYDADKTSIRIWCDEVYGGTNVEIILPIYYAEEGVVYDEDFAGR